MSRNMDSIRRRWDGFPALTVSVERWDDGVGSLHDVLVYTRDEYSTTLIECDDASAPKRDLLVALARGPGDVRWLLRRVEALEAQVAAFTENGVSIHKAVAREREAIVEWLRSRANAPHPIQADSPAFSPSGRGLLMQAADAIERGDHCVTLEAQVAAMGERQE